jgi:hypothetical protein
LSAGLNKQAAFLLFKYLFLKGRLFYRPIYSTTLVHGGALRTAEVRYF